jgi:hypothetical protein
MKRIGWYAVVLLAGVIGLASACGSTQQQGGDTQTNWLKSCTESSECGGFACICGYCAKDCTVTLDCNGTPVVTNCNDPTSAAALALCGAIAPPSGVCLASCGGDTECASTERCVGGACVPVGTVGTEAGAAPEVQTFCEAWVEARCSYVESCGCGAAAAAQCRTEFAPTCGPDGFFAGVANAVASGTVIYDPAAANALLARFQAVDPLCVEETFRDMRLTSDELYSWAGTFVGTLELGDPCSLPVGYKGGFSDCREGACAPRASGGNVCIALVGLGETCDGAGNESLDTATELCFDERPSDSDGEYESAFDSLSCVPDAPGSSTLVCSRGLADGEPCYGKEACGSGRCEFVDTGAGACSPQLASGEACTDPQDCVSGVCDFSVMPNVCGTQKADGEPCTFDGDCVNGRCLSISGMLGVCGPGLADGETCTADINCASEVCRMGSCYADICADYLSP